MQILWNELSTDSRDGPGRQAASLMRILSHSLSLVLLTKPKSPMQ